MAISWYDLTKPKQQRDVQTPINPVKSTDKGLFIQTLPGDCHVGLRPPRNDIGFVACCVELRDCQLCTKSCKRLKPQQLL